jgi:hypothetical protein
MAKLTFDITCGKDTCASVPGVFCQFITANVTGFNVMCRLFDKKLHDKDGGVRDWILRCKECKEAEVK